MLDIRIGLSQIGSRAQAGNYESTDFHELVEFAIKNNITTFDTSPNYGNGDILLSGLPNEFKKVIKINSKSNPGLTNLNSSQQTIKIKEQIDLTLKRFSKSRINTFFINKPDVEKLSLFLFD